jgi:hypothetical protein
VSDVKLKIMSCSGSLVVYGKIKIDGKNSSPCCCCLSADERNSDVFFKRIRLVLLPKLVLIGKSTWELESCG